MTDFGYAINGTVKDFGSTEPIEAHTISDGQLSVHARRRTATASPGRPQVDGLDADVVVQGAGTDAAGAAAVLDARRRRPQGDGL